MEGERFLCSSGSCRKLRTSGSTSLSMGVDGVVTGFALALFSITRSSDISTELSALKSSAVRARAPFSACTFLLTICINLSASAIVFNVAADMRPVEKAGVVGLRLRLLIFSMVFKDAGSAEAGERTFTGAGGIGNVSKTVQNKRVQDLCKLN